MFQKKEIEEIDGEGSEEKKTLFLKKVGVFVVLYFDALVAAIVLIIFISSFFFVINPKFKTINEMEEYSLDDLQSGKLKLDAYLSKLSDYRNLYRNLSDVSRTRIEKVVPQNEQLENFFAQIENITKKQGISIKSMSVVDKSEEKAKTTSAPEVAKVTDSKGELGEASLSLILSDVDYVGAKKIITIFENNLRLMDVRLVKFDAEKKELELSIVSYFLR